MEYDTSDLEKGNFDFAVTESDRKDDIRFNPVQSSSSEIRSLDVEAVNKKSVLRELERQIKLMACKEAKEGKKERRKMKYTARKDRNENIILQKD